MLHAPLAFLGLKCALHHGASFPSAWILVKNR